MSDLISTLRAIVRDELARLRPVSLGIVTGVFSRQDEGGDDNHQVDVRLRDSGVELKRVPVAVARPGLSLLPATGDLVVVAFIGGDLNAAVVLGCLYDGTAQPPVAKPGEVVYQPPESDEGLRRLHLELPNGVKLTVEDGATRLEAGGTQVVITTDGDVEVTARGDLKLTTQGGFSLQADGDVTLEARGGLSLKSTGSALLEGASGATIKSPQIKLAGMTDFSPS